MIVGVALSLAAGAAFGLSNVIARQAVTRTNVHVSMCWNLAVCSVLFAVAWLLRSAISGAALPPLKAAGVYAAAGLFSFVGGRTLLFMGVRAMGAGRASVFRVASPLVTVFLAVALFSEVITWKTALGIALILAGLLATTMDPGRRGAETDSSPWRGLGLGILIACSFGVADVLRKLGVVLYDDPIVATAVGAVMALTVFAAYTLIKGNVREVVRQDRSVVPFLVLSGLASGVAVLTFFVSLRTVPVSIATPLVGTQSMFAILFSHLLDRGGEAITWRLWAACAVVIAGAAVLAGAV